jgi:phospholipase A1/A2
MSATRSIVGGEKSGSGNLRCAPILGHVLWLVLVAFAPRADAQYSSPFFNLTEPNFFLFGFEDLTGGSPVPAGAYANQIKFRIAIRYRLMSVANPTHDSGIHVAYRQNSFWHLWEQSAPFFDNNYNPQAFFYYDSRDYSKTSYAPSFRAFVEHESNGRDGAASRSWNRAGLGVDLGDATKDVVYGELKGWHAFSVAAENADIADFAGRGELVVNLQPLVRQSISLGDVGLTARMRIGGQKFWTNSELNAFVGSRVISWLPGMSFFSHLNASVMLQRFSGTAENLLTYRQSRTVTRIGLATVH